jgi:ATPases of the AAA+ class
MLSLDDCLTANRPCIFVTCESDIEVLKYLESKRIRDFLSPDKDSYRSPLVDPEIALSIVNKYHTDTISILNSTLSKTEEERNEATNKLLEVPGLNKTSVKKLSEAWATNKDQCIDNYFVYSSTITHAVKLMDLLDKKFMYDDKNSESATAILNNILNRKFQESNLFETYIFLNADNYIADKQIVRKIKDILTRYQLEEEFTVNLIFLSQTVCVPPDLERLSEVVFFDLPNEKQLKETANTVAAKLELEKPSEEIVNNLKGLSLFEVEQAFFQSFKLYENIDLNFIREFKKSSIAKTDLLSLLETNTTFDHVGGAATLKQWIKKSYGGWTVEGKKFGLPLLKGLLLIGLPGTGKSLICKAIGNEWGLPVICFDPSRVFSSRVGESEYNIRRVLQIIENISPCVLFVDEVEKGFAGSQSSTFSDSGVTARVIGTFLTWMQECTQPVFTIATSNNIQYLPPELIQRFDEKFFINLPQMNERIDIFRIHLSRLNRKPGDFELEALAQASTDLSGREIEQALREAMYDAFATKKELSTQIILGVLGKKTNLLSTMGEQLAYILNWVGWNEEKRDGVRARFAHPVEGDNLNRVQDEITKLINDTEKNEQT